MADDPTTSMRECTRRWLDAHDLIGMAFEDVQALAVAQGLWVRALSEDGVPNGRDSAGVSYRINVDVVDGRVSRVAGLG